ncbi:hypothetical protein R1flu_010540 [Riccia fluitans]|uniref:Uncharacterized protein n=1 Tax=Riccia fluitans TaxID=41844 RepID=A0ABD1Z5E0_9MARC
MTIKLRLEDMLQHVNRNIPNPAPQAAANAAASAPPKSAQAIQDWDVKDQQAISILNNCMDNSLIGLIMEAKTTNEARNSLQVINYAANDAITKMHRKE